MLRSLIAALVLFILALPHAQAQETPNITRCGAYTLQYVQNGFDDPEDTVSLLLNGKKTVTVADTMVSATFCKDITGDGVPEVMLYGFSGGAHCCFTHSLYSLQNPPRLLLRYFSAHSDALEPEQLDGTKPLELIGWDWRFAYAYGLSFAESVPLPVVFTYQNGRYVDASLRYPAVLRRFLGKSYDEYPGGEYLADYALLSVIGQPGEASTLIQKARPPYRSWLQSYALEVRQSMLSYGMSDWTVLAGAPQDTPRWGIGGSFSGPQQRNLLAMTREGNTAVLRLYTPAGTNITRSAPLMTIPLPPLKADENPQWDAFNHLNVNPLCTVWRAANKHDDALLEDKRTGTLKISAYRMVSGQLTPLTNDALSAAAALLSDLRNVAVSVAAQYKQDKPSAAQQAQRKTAAQAAVTRAQPWTKKTNPPVPLARLGNFSFEALEFTVDQPNRAQVQLPVSYGLTEEKQADEYVQGQRYTMIIDLAKQGGTWTVTNWTLEERKGELLTE